MTLLKFEDDEWGPVGSFNWFATHGTSMSRTNSLISGDNKGAAARFMEDWFEQNGIGSSYSDKFGADGIPRRVSNIIPDDHDNRKLLPLAFDYNTFNSRMVRLSTLYSIQIRF
jgi:neutral ceramidase